MEKKLIKKDVLNIQQYESIKWEQVKDFKFEDGDIIQSGYQEETYRSDGGDSEHYYFHVTRMVLETDQEFEDRKKMSELDKVWAKERRMESYLRLKKEFENE